MPRPSKCRSHYTLCRFLCIIVSTHPRDKVSWSGGALPSCNLFVQPEASGSVDCPDRVREASGRRRTPRPVARNQTRHLSPQGRRGWLRFSGTRPEEPDLGVQDSPQTPPLKQDGDGLWTASSRKSRPASSITWPPVQIERRRFWGKRGGRRGFPLF